jgi:ParB family transcriptional regulator, chromosome partitioning protein
VGTIQKVCTNLNCPVHHPKQTGGRDKKRWKAEQEVQRRDQATANATGLRVLSAIAAAVPVRLLKRDLIFVLEKLVGVLDEPRIETLARQHGIRQKRDEGGIAKTLLAFMRRADEGTLSRLTVEATILLAASRHNGASAFKDAATLYKVDTDAIAQKVKEELTAKAKKEDKPVPHTNKVV